MKYPCERNKALLTRQSAGCLLRAALEKFGKTPLLMDDEMESQYKMVYNRALHKADASAGINLVRARRTA